jgi:opine dehydrogenase
MKIAILGGGHGCYAAAADLSEAGHEVRIWRRDARALQPVVDTGSIVLKDADGPREVRIARATADIAQALAEAQLIVIPSPAVAQEDIARAMAPHLVDGQVVFLPPGTFGSFVMARIVRQAGNRADVAWAETGTLPYLARKHGEREVNVIIRAVRLPTGVYPARKAEQALAVIRAAYPSVHGCGDALSGALMNAGPIIHPPLMVMNAAPLQHFERWDIHNEGTQPAVRAVTDRLDQERVAVREALGYAGPHYPLADHYNNDRWMYGDAHRKLVKSGDWREHIDLHTHRYITEDTELGLAFLASVARWSQCDAPIAQGLLAIVGGFLGRDLRRGRRTLEGLGLAGLDRSALQQLLHDGEA